MGVSLRCPECHSPVQVGDHAFCGGGHTYPVRGGVVDFLDLPPVDGHLVIDHCGEAAGLRSRIDNYVLPWLGNVGPLAGLCVLDDGCGNGQAVKHLLDLGVDAWGIDPGQRSTQWSEHGIPERLFIGDGTQLPFPDATFDAVLSFGVIEHLGEGIASSRRGQNPYKERYLHEMARVLKRGGRALIGAPNGAFPVDFWHTTRSGMRLHLPYEYWMPNSFALRRWTRNSPTPVSIRFLPPGGYFAFQRVRRHWYGRVFESTARTALAVIDRHPVLSASMVNPILVAEMRRL